jgi:hypothetical protein
MCAADSGNISTRAKLLSLIEDVEIVSKYDEYCGFL